MEKIISDYKYEYYIKGSNEKKNAILYIIINKAMLNNLTNESITQYFGDATYHCIPPTILKYKLFVISGFNLKDKKIKKINICCYALIPNEKIETYVKLLDVLKNQYKFNPKIFTIDFWKSSSKKIKKNISFLYCNKMLFSLG